MWRTGIIRGLAIASVVVLSAAGCDSPSRIVRTSDATSPEDKTHQEQLASMSAEDADAAQAKDRTPETRRQPATKRRTGQRVIDQPVRR